jgi:uncharacterized protein (TIRG00374 family)
VQTAAAFPPQLLPVVLLLTLWNYGLRWLKWQFYLQVLRIEGVRIADSLLVFLSGFAMGLTPGKAGELTKTYWLREFAGPDRAPVARTAPIVFAERLTDGIALLLLASFGLVAFGFGALALLTVGVVVSAMVLVVQSRPVAQAVLRQLSRRRPTRRLATVAEAVYASSRELLSGRCLLLGIGIGVVSWMGECAALYVILLGLGAGGGLERLNQATFALATATLVGSVSLLPGGLGATEGTVAGVLQLAGGVSWSVAVAATLLIRACTLWFGVGVGAVALLLLTLRSSSAQGSAQRLAVAPFKQPRGRIWLRVAARAMEKLSDLQPKAVNCSDITPQLAVGGAFRSNQIGHLLARGVTMVVDCREEARDDGAALARAGLDFLHLPAADRHSFSYEQLSAGVHWVLDRLARGGRAFLHCEHGVGRGPLVAAAVLVAQGHTSPEALRIIRAGRWQALPNDRQLCALQAFEAQWRRDHPEAARSFA